MSTDSSPTVGNEDVARIAKVLAPIYQANDWKWGGWGNREASVPSEGELALAMREHIDRVLGDDEVSDSGSGRIEVQAEWYGDKPGDGPKVGISISLHIASHFFPVPDA